MKFINVKYYQFFNGGIFMKVKKLLTLLLATSMLVACGTQTQSSSDKSSSGPAPSTTSSDVPSTSSSSPDTSSPSTSSSEAPSSSSAAPSTSSTAPVPSSSSSDPSTSSSAPVVVTLVSISVTAPTKLAYTTADTALDLTGMVVTANYSDATQRVITEGYTVSTVDFSTAGDKTVTVTFEGKTDSFTITVAQAKPTAWDAALTAKFQANLYGYVPPFFYSPDFGLGTLNWREDTEDKALWALGGTLAAQKEGEDSPLKPIGDLFIADGFVASVAPNFEEGDFYYVMEKAVTFEGKQRFVEARVATINSNGNFVNGGQFYIEIGDSYFYDWAASGFEAAIKGYMNFSEDIPDLPEGFRFYKRYLSQFEEQAESGFVGFQAKGAVALVNEYLDALDNAGWVFKRSTREDVMYDIFSPELKIRLGFDYDQTNQVMTLLFDVPPTVPEYVNYVADLYNIAGRGYVFNYSDDNDSYFYTFNEKLDDGQTLGDLLDKYSPALLNDTDGAFALKGTRQEREGLAYETYVSTTKNISVTIFAFSDEDGIGVQISVEQYNAVPAQFIPAINLLGINIDNVNVQAATPTASAYAYAQVRSAASVAYADALKVFTDILDADTTLGFKVIVPLEDATMSSGEAAKHIEYANDSVRIQFLAWTTTSATIVQVVFYDYEAAPESEWVDGINAVLGEYAAEWDDESQSFYYGYLRDLQKGETLASFIENLSENLLAVEALELELLVSDTTSDPDEAKIILYCEEGSVELLYSNYYHETRAALIITVRLYNKANGKIVNAIGSVMGVGLELVQEGVYSGTGRFGFQTPPALTAQTGPIIVKNYVAADLIKCTALGFSYKSGKMDNGNFIGTFTNSRGYTIQIVLLGDASGKYSGYYQVQVLLP